jgi:hypothetical protein
MPFLRKNNLPGQCSNDDAVALAGKRLRCVRHRFIVELALVNRNQSPWLERGRQLEISKGFNLKGRKLQVLRPQLFVRGDARIAVAIVLAVVDDQTPLAVFWVLFAQQPTV